ncbi:CelD/BcsL family acetyltransferase involved in cellulose biosynthesis [Sphingomonas sp. BE123]|uniref:GNAT family N-acetyltransferase n=1 Tax=Sphingomonas sp. BE123 TaxID=2817842 RepID=UPI00285AF1B2|nr:GNAT family N-acetyltransferase [Sphingomonas sp. BE123]MDR6853164.1 CelD/BcsL family acetyltransferase involved in cellulose biosynthesis [Sphingomonas sp. BE123]
MTATARPTPLNFRIGARTLMAVQRDMVRVPLSLDEAREGRLPVLPPLPREAHGYVVTSLPEDRLEAMVYASGRMIGFVRQKYTRYYADLTGGFDAYMAGLSGNARQAAKRKAKKIAQVSGGDLDIRAYRTPAELETFHDIARRIALRTYQEKLMGEGLPATPEFIRGMLTAAAGDRVRAWLLFIAGEPAAYLYCPAHGETLVYEYVGHDPAFNDLSPGAVLQMEAFRDLFDEQKFARFDFTEGDGQHKRQYSTGGVPCVDVLLLRPSLTNRVTTAALGGFNKTVAGGKALVEAVGLEKLSKKLRRG